MLFFLEFLFLFPCLQNLNLIILHILKFLKKNIALYVLLLSVITFNGAEFFHHHENDLTSHEDNKCSACLFTSALGISETSIAPTGLTVITSNGECIIQDVTICSVETISSAHGRAPPLFHA
jgi:hypothetical protein